MNLQPGHEIAQGKYILQQLLGKGAQGQVWSAQQHSRDGFSKQVVLKCQHLPPPKDEKEKRKNEEFHRMFLNEARLAAKLQHPNVVQIFDLGREGELDYIAMEHVQSRDLETILGEYQKRFNQPLPWPVVVQMMMQLCQGLHYAHTQVDERGNPLDLIHRDLKPANVLLSSDGQIKIIDFGIAKATSNLGRTRTGVLKGTPFYMSPELIQNPKKIDSRADLFALGVMMYRLCTGEMPFNGTSHEKLLVAIVMKEPADFPPKPDLPQELRRLIFTMLSKTPGDRLQTAQELRQSLKGLLQAEGVYPDPDELTDLYASLFPEEQRGAQHHASNTAGYGAEYGRTYAQGAQGGDEHVDPLGETEVFRAGPSVDPHAETALGMDMSNFPFNQESSEQQTVPLMDNPAPKQSSAMPVILAAVAVGLLLLGVLCFFLFR